MDVKCFWWEEERLYHLCIDVCFGAYVYVPSESNDSLQIPQSSRRPARERWIEMFHKYEVVALRSATEGKNDEGVVHTYLHCRVLSFLLLVIRRYVLAVGAGERASERERETLARCKRNRRSFTNQPTVERNVAK